MECLLSLLYSHITHAFCFLKTHMCFRQTMWGVEGRNLIERCLVGHSVSLEGSYPRYDLVYYFSILICHFTTSTGL